MKELDSTKTTPASVTKERDDLKTQLTAAQQQLATAQSDLATAKPAAATAAATRPGDVKSGPAAPTATSKHGHKS